MDALLARDPFFNTVHLLLNPTDDKSDNSPAQSYMRDRNAMASTAVDVKEYPNAYVFVADMPGLKSADIKVQVENDNVLVLSGERKREEETEKDVKYLSMERRTGRFMRKFSLPGNANLESIGASYREGVLTVTVPKRPPPTPKTITVNVA